jgi:hypothetical protein
LTNQFDDTEVSITHALVNWVIDNTYTVVPISYIKRHYSEDVELVEEQVFLKCTWTSTEILEATLIITGSSLDCNKVMQLKKKPATKKSIISPSQIVNKLSIDQQVVDDENEVLKLKVSELHSCIVSRDAEIVVLKSTIEKNNEHLKKATNSWRKF